MLPEDPVILLSFINTKLRDEDLSLDEFCDKFKCKKEVIFSKMNMIGYEYVKDINQFR